MLVQDHSTFHYVSSEAYNWAVEGAYSRQNSNHFGIAPNFRYLQKSIVLVVIKTMSVMMISNSLQCKGTNLRSCIEKAGLAFFITAELLE